MTSCRKIIVLALSKIGIAGGHKPPRQADMDLGLDTLQSLYRQLIEGGALGRARSVIVNNDYVACENDRILRVSDAEGSVILPETIEHVSANNVCLARNGGYDNGMALTLCGTRPPSNGAFVVLNDAASGNTLEFIYDGHVNKWTTISDLTLDDEFEVKTADGVLLEVRTSHAPLSGDINGLAARLALMLADYFEKAPSPLTVRDAQRFEAALTTGFGDDRGRVVGSYF